MNPPTNMASSEASGDSDLLTAAHDLKKVVAVHHHGDQDNDDEEYQDEDENEGDYQRVEEKDNRNETEAAFDEVAVAEVARRTLRQRKTESKNVDRDSLLEVAEGYVPKADFVRVGTGDSIVMFWRQHGWQRANVTGCKPSKTGEADYVCQYQQGVCQQPLRLSCYHVGDSEPVEHGEWQLIGVKGNGPRSLQAGSSPRVEGGNAHSPSRSLRLMKKGQLPVISGVNEYIPEKILKVRQSVCVCVCVYVCVCVCVCRLIVASCVYLVF